jgi:hypothetical protein
VRLPYEEAEAERRFRTRDQRYSKFKQREYATAPAACGGGQCSFGGICHSTSLVSTWRSDAGWHDALARDSLAKTYTARLPAVERVTRNVTQLQARKSRNAAAYAHPDGRSRRLRPDYAA